MYRREYIMSSRVDLMRWLGILQLIMGLLIFIICVVMAAVDLDEWVDNRASGDTRAFGIILTSMNVIWFALPLVAISIGAGTAGSAMSRYEGLQYNISARHVLLALSSMNGVISIGYLVLAGLITFELADADFLDHDEDSVKAVMAMMIVVYVLVFFNMFIAFVCVFVCALWNPPSDSHERPPAPMPVISERIVEEKPYYGREYYSRGRDVYSDTPYYGRSRTMPALKYY